MEICQEDWQSKARFVGSIAPRLPTLTCGKIAGIPKLRDQMLHGPPNQRIDVLPRDRKMLSVCRAESSQPRFAWPFVLCLLLIVTSTGCLRRRMTVRTNPPGAMVYVDRQYIGLSPASTNYTYYGTRNFEIVRDGYRTEKFLRKFNPPWYAIPPLDFVTETLWPYEVRDERIIDVQLSPEQSVPNDALIASGEQLRLQAGQGIAVAPPPTMSAPIPVVPQVPAR